MPYADRTKKNAAVKRWRADVIPRGYGRWLYQRRKLRFDDAERFRYALEEIVDLDENTLSTRIARQALKASEKAEKRLGPWVADEGGK